MQVELVQHGPRSAVFGLWVCGGQTLSDDELARNHCSLGDDILATL